MRSKTVSAKFANSVNKLNVNASLTAVKINLQNKPVTAAVKIKLKPPVVVVNTKKKKKIHLPTF